MLDKIQLCLDTVVFALHFLQHAEIVTMVKPR